MFDENGENIDESIARCIVNGIESVGVTLVEEDAKVVPFEESIADGVDRKILHDGDMKKISVGIISIRQGCIFRKEEADGMDRRIESSENEWCSFGNISSIDMRPLETENVLDKKERFTENISHRIKKILYDINVITHSRSIKKAVQ